MYSDVIRTALEREVAGQQRAVYSVVRGVVRAVSGLIPPEGPLCTYMFMGSSGTGKTHLVHALARVLHGDDRRLVVADCTHHPHGDPWTSFASQIAPLFSFPDRALNKWEVLQTTPLSILLVEYLERGRTEVVKSFAAALETGKVPLPEGRQGSLRNCLVFITSALCSREILDEGPRIGFTATPEEEESERARLYKTCSSAAQKQYGTDLMARLDDLIIFHRLREHHLSDILDRLVDSLNQQLRGRGLTCELAPAARAFLLERGSRNLQIGARELLRAHRRFVEFPVGDLTLSGRIPPGGLILIDRMPDQDHLHFTITARDADEASGPDESACQDVPIRWEDAAASESESAADLPFTAPN